MRSIVRGLGAVLVLGVLGASEVSAQAASALRLPGSTFGLKVATTDGAPAEMAGTYELSFGTSEDYKLTRDGAQVAFGTYRVAGDTLLLDEKMKMGGPLACPVGATYTWKFSSDSLRLKVVQDACLPRMAIVELRALYRKR